MKLVQAIQETGTAVLRASTDNNELYAGVSLEQDTFRITCYAGVYVSSSEDFIDDTYKSIVRTIEDAEQWIKRISEEFGIIYEPGHW